MVSSSIVVNEIAVQYWITATAYLFASNHRLLYTFDFLSSPSSVVMAAVDGRVSLSSINFREDDGENSSAIPPS